MSSVSLKDASVISFGKWLMLFLRRDLSFGPSVDHILMCFSLGEGWGCLFNIFSLKGGAYSSIYGMYIFIVKYHYLKVTFQCFTIELLLIKASP